MSFEKLNLPDYLLKRVQAVGYEKPTPIQEQVIPIILEQHDVMAEAQTGTGKTAAFALPMIKMISELPPKKKKQSVLGVVLVPTRELAIQVNKAFLTYAQGTPKELKCMTLIGGDSIQQQAKDLRRGVDVVVATPGRLVELIEKRDIRLFEMKMLVLDEADKMLDLGFKQELTQLLDGVPKNRQTLLFSATMPPKVIKLSQAMLNNPKHITTTENRVTVEKINQRVIQVDKLQRRQLLTHLIKTEKWKHAIIFVASKRAARNITNKMKRDGINVAAFHGDLKQDERVKVLKRFEHKDITVLVATDIAARGIDIENLTHVVNYDLPRSPLDYVHRIGRTGRAGQDGIAISFVDEETEAHFRLIEKRIKQRLGRETVAGFEPKG